MLTRQLVEELAAFQSDEGDVLSVYLTVNRANNPRSAYLTRYRNLAREAAAGGGPSAEDVVDQVERWLRDQRGALKRGLIVIVGPNLDLFYHEHLNIELPERVVMDENPYLKPMADLLDNHQRDAIAVVDQEGGRVLLSHLGTIEEYTESLGDEAVRRHRQGGWLGMAANRYRRRQREKVRVNLQQVVEALEDLVFGGEYVGRILVGGPVEARARFLEMLPQRLGARVMRTFNVPSTASLHEILELTRPLAQATEEEFEDVLAQEILTRAAQNDRGAVGLEDVLWQLHSDNVFKLAVQRGLRAAGVRCESCSSIAPGDDEHCRYCGEETDRIQEFVDELVQAALRKHAHVEVLSTETALSRAGGIGAILRG